MSKNIMPSLHCDLPADIGFRCIDVVWIMILCDWIVSILSPYITIILNLQRWFRTETDISPAVYGAICSSVSWIVTYPLDTYKTNTILRHSLGMKTPKRPLFDMGLVYSLGRVSLGGSIFMTIYTALKSREPTVPYNPPFTRE
jgi:hypothetical protein